MCRSRTKRSRRKRGGATGRGAVHHMTVDCYGDLNTFLMNRTKRIRRNRGGGTGGGVVHHMILDCYGDLDTFLMNFLSIPYYLSIYI